MAKADHSENIEKTTKADDSDDSDFIATDSGRHSFQAEDENDQPDNEEILIDIPTIRPPVGFRSPVDEEYLSENLKLQKEPQNPSPAIDCYSSKPDSDLDWTYPKIPKVKIIHSNFESSEKSIKRAADKNEWLPEKEMELFQNKETLRRSYRSFNRHTGKEYNSSPNGRRYQQKRNPTLEKRHRSLERTDIRCHRNQRKESRSVDRLDLRDDLHHTISKGSEDRDFINEQNKGETHNHEQENYDNSELCERKIGIIETDFNEFGDSSNVSSADRQTNGVGAKIISSNCESGYSDGMVRSSPLPSPEENDKHWENVYNFLPDNSNQLRKPDKKKVWDIFNVGLSEATERHGGSIDLSYKISNSDELGERRLETVVEEKPDWKNDDPIVGNVDRPSTSVWNEKEVKYVDSSGFFFRPNTTLFGSLLDVESSQVQTANKTLLEEPIRPVTKMFPLPVAYRNNLLLRRKFNSDLYSGVEKTTDATCSLYDTCNNDENHAPTDSISALVHREITEAVKEMNGWL
ncbi:uncharacterized protein LOC111089905 [Limulus polyphemus]|uniref:Uncharacterized protein LOC111089905 n=1 Tax=Limulus polyphemus TaxID=6850 RepID=A0ABM1TSL0_LIMPO|nr:uncharacterized protein LOC111089905 [Limulus polyphemus]